jgi:predicted acyltransferase
VEKVARRAVGWLQQGRRGIKYMMAHMFDFSSIGNIFVGGLSSLFASNVQAFIQAVGAMTVMWLIMYLMYRKRIFIKI